MAISTDAGGELETIGAAVAAGDLARAFDAANRALRNQVSAPAVYNARALWFQAQGRHDEALAEFGKALGLAPNDANLLNAIGLCAARCGRTGEALAAFDRAIALIPRAAFSHYGKGWVYAITGDRPQARAAYARAIELDPNFSDALGAFAEMAMRDGEPETARDYAQRCLVCDPVNATAISVLATVELEAGRPAEAETLLRQALERPDLPAHQRSVLQGYLGDALDSQQRYEEAFAAYKLRAEEMVALHGAQMAAIASPTKRLASLSAYLQWAPPQSWQSHAAKLADGPRAHVFILGFMRSGTTLLEKVLAQHPDAVSLEERPSLDALASTYMQIPEGLNRLRALDELALLEARERYWAGVRGLGCEPAGKVFIDKQPLNTINLPLIAKLFPDAKIVFALRDPRDVVFSCFRRQFEISPVTFQFLTLEGGARFYAAVMTIAQICRERVGLRLFDHRYEDMIGDFEGRVRAACDFIGLEWDEALAQASGRISRSAVRSPSAAQVARPLYGDAIGEWRHYAGEIGKLDPILAPWVSRFGYSKD